MLMRRRVSRLFMPSGRRNAVVFISVMRASSVPSSTCTTRARPPPPTHKTDHHGTTRTSLQVGEGCVHLWLWCDRVHCLKIQNSAWQPLTVGPTVQCSSATDRGKSLSHHASRDCAYHPLQSLPRHRRRPHRHHLSHPRRRTVTQCTGDRRTRTVKQYTSGMQCTSNAPFRMLIRVKYNKSSSHGHTQTHTFYVASQPGSHATQTCHPHVQEKLTRTGPVFGDVCHEHFAHSLLLLRSFQRMLLCPCPRRVLRTIPPPSHGTVIIIPLH